MAERAATITRPDETIINVAWATFTGDDVGEAFDTAGEGEIAEAMVYAGGNFNSQTLTWQGSFDGSTWFTLNDLSGAAMETLATGAFREIRSLPRFIRPDASGAMTSGAPVAQFRRAVA